MNSELFELKNLYFIQLIIETGKLRLTTNSTKSAITSPLKANLLHDNHPLHYGRSDMK